MRACFLGQNVTALGFGVAMLQTPPLAAELKADDAPRFAPEPPNSLKVGAFKADPFDVTAPEAA